MTETVDLTPQDVTLIIHKGDDPQISLVWKDSAGDPIDLTGYAAKLQVKKDFSEAVIFTLTDASEITLGGIAGTIVILIPNSITSTLTPGLYKYDLQLTDNSSLINTLIKGAFEVQAEVTT